MSGQGVGLRGLLGEFFWGPNSSNGDLLGLLVKISGDRIQEAVLTIRTDVTVDCVAMLHGH